MIPDFQQFQSKSEFLVFYSNECLKNMNSIPFNHPQESNIQNTYATVLRYLSKNEKVAGGCHFMSTMLHILLNEQGIKNDIMIGEVKDSEEKILFSHSWIEIDEKVFDPGIMITLDGKVHSPVYNSTNLTFDLLNIEYGVSDNLNDLDRDAKQALDISITAYLDGIKNYGFPKNFLWDEILKVGIGMLGYTNLAKLRKKYDEHYRIFKG